MPKGCLYRCDVTGGNESLQILAEKLDVPFYDKQLLDRIAEESGFSKEMIKGARPLLASFYIVSRISDFVKNFF